MNILYNKNLTISGVRGNSKDFENIILPELTFLYEEDTRYLKIGDDKTICKELVPVQCDGLPKGSIIMWNKNLEEIPCGWEICDGHYNEKLIIPDLRNRFIKCVKNKNTNPNSSDSDNGKHKINLIFDNLPIHNHGFIGNDHIHDLYLHSHSVTISTTSGGAHRHSFDGVRLGGGGRDDDYSAYAHCRGRAPREACMLNGGDHTHIITGEIDNGGKGWTHNSYQNGTISTEGNNSIIDNQPPFYEIFFIIKVV